MYHVAIATVIFLHVKITCYFHMWRYHVFARKLTWYFIDIYIINTNYLFRDSANSQLKSPLPRDKKKWWSSMSTRSDYWFTKMIEWLKDAKKIWRKLGKHGFWVFQSADKRPEVVFIWELWWPAPVRGTGRFIPYPERVGIFANYIAWYKKAQV